ncbi:hypothetical protein INT43_008537 [Umbelopsis isabellina]|uniref:Uncharacterized protein n=1 Tax=Mortierella isabellina TaxID=91625 RepID=A0A8H7PVB0_MORIS|nr:hypothetical protein INT43_008537 [Umbelopsis isabellina]
MLFTAIFAEHIVIDSPSNATTVAPGDVISVNYTVSPDAYAPIGSVRADLAAYDAKTILYPNITYAEWSDWHTQGGSVRGTWEVPEDLPSGWYHIIFKGVTGGHCTIPGTQKYRTCPGESTSSTMIYVD